MSLELRNLTPTLAPPPKLQPHLTCKSGCMLHLVVSESHFYSSSHITATAVPLTNDLHHILSPLPLPPKKWEQSWQMLYCRQKLYGFFLCCGSLQELRTSLDFCVESLNHEIAIPVNCSLRGESVVCPTITQAAARLKLFHFISCIDFAVISSLSYGNFLHCTICASACCNWDWVLLWYFCELALWWQPCCIFTWHINTYILCTSITIYSVGTIIC